MSLGFRLTSAEKRYLCSRKQCEQFFSTLKTRITLFVEMNTYDLEPLKRNADS